MNKSYYKSKTVQGLFLALLGTLFGIWTGESELSASLVAVGLAYAGIGARAAIGGKK